MESKYSSRGFFAPRRIILMVVLFLFLTSLFCSKGDRTIEPVLPPPGGSQIDDNESSDIMYGNPSRDTTDSPPGYRQKLIPFMAVETFDEIENKVRTLIGDIEVQEGQIIFINAEPSGSAKQNPPTVSFSFVATENAISPDEISILVDNQDISANFTYNVYYSHIRKANFYSGFFELDYYLNPMGPHELKINFHPENGGLLEKRLIFNVSQDSRLKLLTGGYIQDQTSQDFIRDKIIIVADVPEFLLRNDSLLKVQTWEIIYEDGTSLPLIQEVTKVSSHFFHVKFSSNIDCSRTILVKYCPSEGICSNQLSIGPIGFVDRGGGAYRNLESYPACQTCILDMYGQRYGFTGSQEHDAQDCEGYHWIRVNSYCPPRNECQPGIQRKYEKITQYIFENNYENECHDTPIALTAITYPGGIGTCGNIYNLISQIFDYEVVYDMLANPLPNPPNDYCIVDSTDPLTVHSDQELPTVDAHFEPVIKCAPGHCGPNCDDPSCMDCEKWTEYVLNVDAYDNKCILENMFFYIYFPNYVYPVTFVPISTNYNNNYVHREFKVNPNIFACAYKMKIIVKDKKGNWNCKEMESMDKEQCPSVYDPSKLPYPCDLSLTFDSRRPVDSFGKQYVNLNYQLENNEDQDVCTHKLIVDPLNDLAVNHGPCIYMEVETFPPMGGILVNVEYRDPPFTRGNNDAPTNDRFVFQQYGDCNDYQDFPDAYSESNNHNLNAEGWHKLWKSHTAYGDDGRTLGDNWNYYPGNISLYNIPDCDPIIADLSPRITPCFWSCVAPEGEYCQNQYCIPGVIGFDTEIHGKFGVYFDTIMHGGDNFKFRAYANNTLVNLPPELEPLENCLSHAPGYIFTVYRKIYLDYVWMEKRDEFPSCNDFSNQKEYNDIHHINNGNFSTISGVFDDCFIEISPNYRYYNTPYQFMIIGYEIVTYADEWTSFRPPPNDTVLLLGVDHLSNVCKGSLGKGVPYYEWPWPDDAYYNYCAVGYIYDRMIGRKKPAWFDKKELWNPLQHDLLTSAHELGHCLASKGELMDYDYNYGLMRDMIKTLDPRSYFHGGHIMDLRSELPNFDANDK